MRLPLIFQYVLNVKSITGNKNRISFKLSIGYFFLSILIPSIDFIKLGYDFIEVIIILQIEESVSDIDIVLSTILIHNGICFAILCHWEKLQISRFTIDFHCFSLQNCRFYITYYYAWFSKFELF